ncbi:SH3 domain-containing protein [Planctomycetota bacterium]
MRAQPKSSEWTQTHTHTVFFVGLFFSLTSLTACLGQTPLAPESRPVTAPEFPFKGVITGMDVHVRSGAGTHYYWCAKLNQGDTVTVLGKQDGWSKIVPPPGCFSWIAMQYVKVSINDPADAIVTGQNVTVYAGSDRVLPMHSTSEQVILKRNSKIRLLKGEEKDGYFKIYSPPGSFLWVSSLYVEKETEDTVRSVTPVPVVPPVANETNEPVPAVAPVLEVPENEHLKAYYILQEKTMAELGKPLLEQNYQEIKKELAAIIADEAAGDVKRYAEHLVNRIEGYELARQVSQTIKQQDESLAGANARIQEALAKRKAEIGKTGRFAVIGVFRASSIYNSAQVRRYRVQDATGRTICYAEAAGEMLGKDVQSYVGKKVGLAGTIKPFAAVNGALVLFTEIVEIP